MLFTKSRRAQSVDDYETWVESEVTNTLNTFDLGDIRTTTLIIFYGNRVADIRIQGDVINTLQARMGTGGNNMPILAYPIQDGREMEKNQNGLGLGAENDPSYTIDRTGAQAVAYSIREDAKANNFSATEIEQARALQSLQPSVQSHHAQTFIAETVAPTLTAYNMDSRSPQSEEQQRIINSVFSNTMRVRRLTPTECERLQGFPDGWTDEQSDTQRYKQMGNAVTVNVIEWIGSRL
jgi:DNA (cytosine-5)-methyltransferase 1